MESLGLDIKLFVAQVVNFLILFFVLTKFLYKPLLKLLDDRKKKVEETYVKSHEIEERLSKLEEEKKTVLEKERQKGKEEVSQLLSLAGQEKERILGEAKAMAVREVEKGIERIKAQESNTAAKLKNEFTKVLIDEIINKLRNDNGKDGKHPMLKKLLK
jgi:F-type H+-transporting ATPase subunit b